ncbi:MAG TPA: hypothetical protein VF041_01225 [Gemmatimonadaceae bacterium]
MPENTSGAPELQRKVATWLNQHGFPFELQVGRAFNRSQFDVQHVRFYRDSITSKPRQIDVVATRIRYVPEAKAFAGLTLVMECKYSSRPWVVFSSRAGPADAALAFTWVAGRLSSNLLCDITIDLATGGSQLALLAWGARRGHGIMSALHDTKADDSEPKNYAYDALRSAVAGAVAIAAEVDALYKSGVTSPGFEHLNVVLPVVVLRGKLFEAYLDEYGQLVVAPCDRATLLTHAAKDGSLLLAHVVCEDVLSDFIEMAYQDADRIIYHVSKNAAQIMLDLNQVLRGTSSTSAPDAT